MFLNKYDLVTKKWGPVNNMLSNNGLHASLIFKAATKCFCLLFTLAPFWTKDNHGETTLSLCLTTEQHLF